MQTQFRELIWSTRAPAKLKIFAWLLHQYRLWCNDRLQRRGWPNNYFCQLCLRNLESSEHVCWRCPLATPTWKAIATWKCCRALGQESWIGNVTSLDKFRAMSDATPPAHRKAIKSLAMLALWQIWQERNHRTFRAKEAKVEDILNEIRRGLSLWQQAGIKSVQSPFGDPSGE